MLSCIPTYKYELTLMVGKSCLATLGSANSFGIRVGGLTSKGQVGVFLGEHRGVDTAHGSPYKGQTIRQSDVRPEAFAASFQTVEENHQHSFLCSNI